MAATIAVLGSAFTTTAGNKTVTATPTNGDLIVVVAVATGATTTVTDNATGGTYTQVDSTRTGFSTTGNLQVFVRNNLVTSAGSTIYTATQTSSTGGGLVVLRITGMALTGSAAVRSSGGQSTGTAGTTPAPVLSLTPLSSNPIITAVASANTVAGSVLVQRATYTEDFDNVYSTPATAMEVAHLASGETSATLTAGGTSTTQFASIAIELQFNTAPTTALNTPANASTIANTTPTLNFTGTDADGDTVEYEVQVDTVNTFDSVAGGVNTYYFDGHTAITDSANNWTNDANAFDGSTSTSASTSTLAAGSFLIGKGTTALTRTTSVTQVQVRFFWSSNLDAGQWSSLVTVPAPSGGWTWSNINSLETDVTLASSPPAFWTIKVLSSGTTLLTNTSTSPNSSSTSWNLFRVELSITEVAGPLLDKLSTADTGFTTGHPFASGVAKDFTVQVANALSASTQYFWRVRAIDPTGSNTYGAYATTRSFTTATVGLVQEELNTKTAGASTVAATFPQNATTGNLAIVAISSSGTNHTATGVTDNQTGNTYTEIGTAQVNSGGTDYIQLFYAKNINASGAFTITATFPGTTVGCTIAIFEYKGYDTVSPLDQNAQTSGTSNAPAAGSITPTLANELVFAAMVDTAADGTTIAAGSGYFAEAQQLVSSIKERLGTEYQLQAAATATSGTFATGSSIAWGAKVASFKQPSGTNYTPSALTETVTYTDTFIKQNGRFLTETITYTDKLLKQAQRLLSETITYTDSFIKLLTHLFTGTETITYTDNIIRQASRLFSDTVIISDTLIKKTGRFFSDVITYTDTLLKTGGKFLSEVITYTDSFTGIKITSKLLSEIATLTDTFIKTTSRLLNETITHSDTFIAKITARVLLETLTHTDTLIRQAGKMLTDTLTETDTLIRTGGKNLAETVTTSDTINRIFARIYSETTTLIDTLKKTGGKMLSDILTHTDTFSAAKVTAKVLTEIATLTDTFIKTTSRLFSEIVTASDTIIRIIGRNLLETITHVDAIMKVKAAAKALTETLTSTDVINKAMGKVLTDTASFVDTFAYSVIQAFHSYSQTLTETITTSDAFTKLKTAAANLFETITSTDTFTRLFNVQRVFSESLSLFEILTINLNGKKWYANVKKLFSTDTGNTFETKNSGVFETDNTTGWEQTNGSGWEKDS